MPADCLMVDPERLRRAYRIARDELLAARDPAGHWVGELSSSALSTATAISALSVVARHRPQRAGGIEALVWRGVGYLARSQNDDGGWGDTDRSLSNIATTMLVRAAFHLAGVAEAHRGILGRAERYIDSRGGLAGLGRRYGRDRTFAVPILTNGALAGLVRWRDVPPLPFELACLPQATFRFLRLPVVSYAIPALVAVGLARYVHARPANPLLRLLRRVATGHSLETARRMQPERGGFLEATPLTSFVVMSLAGSGYARHPLVARGVAFLVRSVRADGSWPIDTNLATWLTTLAVGALAASGEPVGSLGLLDWLLACQHRRRHPFTGADPGGWGWTDLSGGVPDADDTAGALVALARLRREVPGGQIERITAAARLGGRWLLDLQNADGGWPTFCRGWGKLPFDRSGLDLTAHAVRGLIAWPGLFGRRGAAAARRGMRFLARSQRDEGSWVPLWFGNQYQPGEENPVYGTARVLAAYRDLGLLAERPARRGIAWLQRVQNADGGWGGGPARPGVPRAELSSVEETALAVEALGAAATDRSARSALARGTAWLVRAVEAGGHRRPSPIGFYFARLWYYERLYPLVFSVAALGCALGRLGIEPAARADPETV